MFLFLFLFLHCNLESILGAVATVAFKHSNTTLLICDFFVISSHLNRIYVYKNDKTADKVNMLFFEIGTVYHDGIMKD